MSKEKQQLSKTTSDQNTGNNNNNTLAVSDTDLIDIIKNKFNRDLSQPLQKLIIESRRTWVSTQEKVANLMTQAVEDGFQKEEAKQIVAMLMGVSVRSVERYTPAELKDPKYVDTGRENREKTLKKTGEGTDQDYDDDNQTDTITTGGGVGDQDQLPLGTQEQRAEQISKDNPQATIKKLMTIIKDVQKKRKEEQQITLLGKTAKCFTEVKFNIDVETGQVECIQDLIYTEKDLIRAFKSS